MFFRAAMAREEISALLLLFLLVPVHLQQSCEGGSCHPSLGDLMVGRAAQLSASSTCGLNGPQNYCILGYLENEQKCFSCDSRRPYNHYNNRYSHQIENAITTFEPERKMRWWQSENGVQRVSIQLDLETVFQFSHLVLTFKSFRPAAMLVERSKDFGRTWKVFRYFAADCANDFPGVSRGQAESIDDLICDSRYSGPEPSTDGEVVLKALDPNFNIDDPYDPTIQELITMTNLRVNFTRLFTLGDNLLGRRRRHPEDKYYYALYEMVVRGSCFCYGHASQCMPMYSSRGDVYSEPGMVHGRCVCQHNTAGDNCEKCQDFYNDAPWRPAGHSDPHVCKKCNCNGHSEKCHFDLERYMATGQVSGGVCDDCRNNRVGAQCEQCQPRFYRDPQRPSVEDPAACIPCSCDPAGSVDCGLCDPVTGHCVCKQNVEGERCDRCKLGFYGLSHEENSGCQRCQCNFLGTKPSSPCDQTTGQCICENFALGPECDQCLPGYWGLGNTVYGCLPCDCDIGGAFSIECSSVNGQCQCRANMIGLSCSEPAPGYFLAPLDFYLYEAENAAPLDTKCSSYLVKPTALPAPLELTTTKPPPHFYCTPGPPTTEPPTLPRCDEYFRSRGYDFTFSDGKFVVVTRERRRARKRRQDQRSISLQPGSSHQIILRPHSPDAPVLWTGLGFVRVQDGAGLRFIVTNIPLNLNYHIVIRYEPESTDDWRATAKVVPLGPYDENCPNDPSEKTVVLSSTRRAATFDPSVCLSTGVRYYVDITFEKRSNPDPYCRSHIRIDSMGLIPKIESLPSFCSGDALAQYQQYQCVELVSQAGEHTLPEVCEQLVGSMSAFIHNGAIPCRCNPLGSFSSSCSKFGGQCDCKPSVIGRCCDTCAPMTYGFGPNGCSPCNCEPSGSRAEMCDSRTGQCPCHNEITGQRCDRCLPGYYGFPNCKRCQCNGLSDLCDSVTGVCLNCKEHSTGPHCERCVEGYFGDPVSRETCLPCQCPDVKGSGRFFARTCSKDPNALVPICECETGHQGIRCEACTPGYYGNLILPGERCKECPCNNNIDPRDGEACDAVTGECLRCLHNTHGPYCQTCRPGYYGNALHQDCRECSCDQLGTELVRCPPGGSCICNAVTGQCPCRAGVEGVRCDQCKDGHWNLQSGCQPCACNSQHSLSNLCDKITGQCPCEREYGGKQCNKCAENHFGNPDIQCISCDCNMEGTIHPGCDPYTGECLCRAGVSGIFCDECAPGHDPVFPACEPCHTCFLLWEKNITDITQTTSVMLSLIPHPGTTPNEKHLQKRMQELNDKLKNLVNMLGLDQNELDNIEKLLNQIRNLAETIDPNIIIVDPSPLLNTDIDNIQYEFKRLVKDLERKLKEGPKLDLKALNDTLEKIRKLHSDFMKDEERVKQAEGVLDSSRQIRQDTKKELAKCEKRPLDVLNKKVQALSVAQLNEEICGAPGDVECEKAKCGGALCGTCGGPSCTGSVPVSEKALDTAKKTEKGILDLLQNLSDAEVKMKEVKNMSESIKDKAQDMMKKITISKNTFEKDKNVTKKLIIRVREYLTADSMEPEDINMLASAVLAIQLPNSPDEIKKMIQDIQILLANFTHFKEDLKPFQDQAELAKELKQKADEILNKTKQIDVTEIQKNLNDAAQLQDKIKQDLSKAEDNNNVTKQKLDQSADKLKNTEDNLSTTETNQLLDEIEALKNKTAMNQAQAAQAKAAADAALADATDASKDLMDAMEQFKNLTEKNQTQGANDAANERLNNIKLEAENLAKDIEDKLSQIEDLEKRIQDAALNKEKKMKELEDFRKQVENLQRNISEKVEKYVQCST
ncbi:laminin subunit beta-4 [Hoplias malabaricus]|uniref:laminin subunit beta-4 n=1 Tax=Hoplias malabaricus TaxID=27720 RepID=UPI0034637D4D